MTDRTRSHFRAAPALLFSIALLVALAPGGVADRQQLPERQELPEGVTAAMVEAGQALYEGDAACVTCHGEGGVGGLMGPPLIEGEWLQADGTYPSIVGVVTNGVAEPVNYERPMRARGGKELTDEQVSAVAAYVWLISRDR